jgi:hypothetical protein
MKYIFRKELQANELVYEFLYYSEKAQELKALYQKYASDIYKQMIDLSKESESLSQ